VFQARYIAIEHRYYGKSMPTPDFDYKGLLGRLTVEQALADAAAFIEAQIAARQRAPLRQVGGVWLLVFRLVECVVSHQVSQFGRRLGRPVGPGAGAGRLRVVSAAL
jgi:phage gp36-like protein